MDVLNTNTLAQLAHIGWGGMGCFILWAKSVSRGYSIIIVATLAAAKETSETIGIAFWEPKQPWLSSLEDFAFFLVGVGVFLFITRKMKTVW